MNKALLEKIALIVIAVLLAAAFLVLLLLSLPLGERAAVIGVTTFYFAGGALAVLSLGCALFLFLRRRKGS